MSSLHSNLLLWGSLAASSLCGCDWLPSGADLDPRKNLLCPYQFFPREGIPGMVGKADGMKVMLCGVETEIAPQEEEFELRCVPCPQRAQPCPFALEFRAGEAAYRFESARGFDSCGLAASGVSTTLKLHEGGLLTWETSP